MEELQPQGKNRRQLQAEQTKDRLFNAAISLLAEKEFEQITIREIVSAAQVSIGTFYKYYSTKMEVFYETYRIADHYFTQTVAPTLTQESALDRILAFFDAYAYYNGDMTDMKMTKLLYNPDNPFFNRSLTSGMPATLISVLQYGLEQGEFVSEEPPEEIAEYLMIATRGLVYNWCTKDGSYPLGAAMRKFIQRLLKAYLP